MTDTKRRLGYLETISQPLALKVLLRAMNSLKHY